MSKSRPASSAMSPAPLAGCSARPAHADQRTGQCPATAQPHNVTTASLVTAPATPVTMERMLDAPEQDELRADEAQQSSPRVVWWRSLQATSTRRALLLTALGGLLIAGVLTALPRSHDPTGLTGSANSIPLTGARGNATFNHAKSGDC